MSGPSVPASTLAIAHALHLPIAGPGAEALSRLTPAQRSFIRTLPKAELHAHLNGSIPLPVLQQLARERAPEMSHARAVQGGDSVDIVADGLRRLEAGVTLTEIGDFFGLFPAIYALTSTPEALKRAARAVLETFLGPAPSTHDSGGWADGDFGGCAYLELRSTPRATDAMSRREYVRAVLEEVERYPVERAALIVSLDRRMGEGDAIECVDVAIELRAEGRRVVGVDLCGDPMKGDVGMLCTQMRRAKAAGLGVTLHIAETALNPPAETLQLLQCGPDRLGHATFLDEQAKDIVRRERMCVEICLSSNLLCKTVETMDAHHIRYYLQHDHPIAICTDDILPFRNSLAAEYALLLAAPPFGLGLSEDEVCRVAQMGMERRFT